VIGLVATALLCIAAIGLVISLRDRQRILIEERRFLAESGLLRADVERLESRVTALEKLLSSESGE